MLFDKKMQDNVGNQYVLPWTRQAVLDAYRRSGLTVDDIDVFEIHGGNAGEYQVLKDGKLPRNGIMLNIGGTSTTNYVFVVGR